MRSITIDVDETRRVDGLLQAPTGASACYVMAHGAGAGMNHAFMEAVADGLAARKIATLRYQFPYMQRGSRRPDSSAIAHATVRAAVAEAARLVPELPLFAGGKSYGGRMTSETQAETRLPGLRGIAFLGFPLHPPGKPADERAKHLCNVGVPLLFLQGARDDFADLSLLAPLVQRLGKQASLRLFDEADHSFHLPKRTGRKDVDVLGELLDVLVDWLDTRR
jgi:predicted alpha/beta-hydrolase family hydrolase